MFSFLFFCEWCVCVCVGKNPNYKNKKEGAQEGREMTKKGNLGIICLV